MPAGLSNLSSKDEEGEIMQRRNPFNSQQRQSGHSTLDTAIILMATLMAAAVITSLTTPQAADNTQQILMEQAATVFTTLGITLTAITTSLVSLRWVVKSWHHTGAN